LDLSEEAEREMIDEVDTHGQHKHGRHRYTPEQYGYQRSTIDALFAEYRQAFAVPSEE
jgi:hypothetical protein